MGSIKVDMNSFRANFIWNSDTVKVGDTIAKSNGNIFTMTLDIYKNALNDCGVFYTCDYIQ